MITGTTPRPSALSFSALFLGRGNERHDKFLVEGKKMLDPVTVVLEGLWSIGEINGTVGFCVRRS